MNYNQDLICNAVLDKLTPALQLLTRPQSPIRFIQPLKLSNINLFQHKEKQEPIYDYTKQFNEQTNLQGQLIYRRGGQQIWPWIKPEDTYINTSNQLNFQSRFQSGNLKQVYVIKPRKEYNLILQKDVNTQGFYQWFYFKITNTRQKEIINFKIINLYKQTSLIQNGMKIAVYSIKMSQRQNIGWTREGFDIKYYKNGIVQKKKKITLRTFYTLSFKYQFKFDNDQVYFANSFPYSYSDLRLYLDQIQNDVRKNKYLKRSTLCKSLIGNKIQMLSIGNQNNFSQVKKKIIVMTARVHPGQTVGSFAIKGAIDFLLSEQQLAKKLRDKFIFKIVPMLNPDGVIHGNSRCSIAGVDLNRKWILPSMKFHPQIYYLKNYIIMLSKTNQVKFFCDFHGHSRKKNCFIYACHNVKDTYQIKKFPFLLSKILNIFSFKDCCFGIEPNKQSTARAVLHSLLKITEIYTVQTSFLGGSNSNLHFSKKIIESIGKKICIAILIYFYRENDEKQQFHQIPVNKKQYQDQIISNGSFDSPEQDCFSQTTLEKIYNKRINRPISIIHKNKIFQPKKIKNNKQYIKINSKQTKKTINKFREHCLIPQKQFNLQNIKDNNMNNRNLIIKSKKQFCKILNDYKQKQLNKKIKITNFNEKSTSSNWKNQRQNQHLLNVDSDEKKQLNNKKKYSIFNLQCNNSQMSKNQILLFTNFRRSSFAFSSVKKKEKRIRFSNYCLTQQKLQTKEKQKGDDNLLKYLKIISTHQNKIQKS